MPLNTVQGPYIKAHGISNTLTSNFATSSTSYVSTGVEATCRADAGDLIQVNQHLLYNSEAQQSRLDAQTIVGGSPVNSVSGLAISGTGVDGWLARPQSILTNVQMPVFYQVVPGDISGGTVTFRIYIKCDAPSTRTIVAGSSGNGFWFDIINWGPVDSGGGVGFSEQNAGHFSKVTLSGGAIGALSNTTYSSATPGVTVAAREGDLILVGGDWLWFSEAVNGYSDAATIVGGSPVNYVSGGGASDTGVPQWVGFATAFFNAGVPVPYTVVAGDISGGTVTFNLRNKVASGTKNFIGTNPKFYALNLGQRTYVTC